MLSFELKLLDVSSNGFIFKVSGLIEKRSDFKLMLLFDSFNKIALKRIIGIDINILPCDQNYRTELVIS